MGYSPWGCEEPARLSDFTSLLPHSKISKFTIYLPEQTNFLSIHVAWLRIPSSKKLENWHSIASNIVDSSVSKLGDTISHRHFELHQIDIIPYISGILNGYTLKTL